MNFQGKAGWSRRPTPVSFGQIYTAEEEPTADDESLTGVVGTLVAERNLWTTPMKPGELLFSPHQGREYSLPADARKHALAIESASRAVSWPTGIISLYEQPNGRYLIVACHQDEKLGYEERQRSVETIKQQKPLIPERHQYALA